MPWTPGADCIIRANILTLAQNERRVEALAIAAGRIVYAGDEQRALALRGAGTVVHDMRGYTVIPGFNDTHARSVTTNWI